MAGPVTTLVLLYVGCLFMGGFAWFLCCDSVQVKRRMDRDERRTKGRK